MRPFITLNVLLDGSYNTTLACVAVDEILYLQQRPGYTFVLLKCGVEWEVQESVGQIAAALHAASVL